MSYLEDIKSSFRALKSRNFLLFFIGQGISLTGTWVQYTAMGWLVYRLTESAFLLGVVGFASKFPSAVFAPFAGVLADRWSRHHILLITQIVALVQALILALLVITDTVHIWHIILLSILYGFLRAFEIPTRHSLFIELIDDKKDLSNAIALNSSLFNLARLLGPSIGGFMIALAGEGNCFLLNSISYVAIILALLAMNLKPQEKEKTENKNMAQALKEGFSYAFGINSIKAILFMISIISLMGVSYSTLLPVFAKEIFQGGPEILGFIMSAAGFGALVGAFILATRKDAVGLEKIIPLSGILLGAGLAGFAFSETLWLSLILIFWAAFGMMMSITACNTLLQTIVEENKRGRIMSLYTMAFMGMLPIGSFLVGALATKIGTPFTVFIEGIFCIIGSALFFKYLSFFKKEQPLACAANNPLS